MIQVQKVTHIRTTLNAADSKHSPIGTPREIDPANLLYVDWLDKHLEYKLVTIGKLDDPNTREHTYRADFGALGTVEKTLTIEWKTPA